MIAVCLLTKNENKYLCEWVEHHLNIGIEHFYIYDNNDDLSASKEILKYFDEKYFTFVPWLSYCKSMQIEAYNDCLSSFGADNDWIAFIDTDEFIACDNLYATLAKYNQYDYIKIPWVMHNANGQVYASNEPVRKRFARTIDVKGIGWEFKSIVQPSRIQHMKIHDAVSVSHNEVYVDDIVLDHYFTRSLEEWVEKIMRGSCSPSGLRRYDEFFVYNPDLIQYKDKYINVVQKYNDCLKTIDIRIMAHPSRRENVLKVLEQLNMDESIVVYDDREYGGDALYTARKTWLSPVPLGTTHRLVLQDDVLLCDNFLSIICDIVNTLPDKVLSLFNLIPYDLIKDRECCYKKYETLAGQAIIMPVIYIKECWQWIDANCGECKHDDIMISKYCKHHGIGLFTTIPPIVQHLGDTEYQSLLPAKHIGLRISTTYVQHPTDDFTVFIPEKLKLQKFKEAVRMKRAEQILHKRGDKICP